MLLFGIHSLNDVNHTSILIAAVEWIISTKVSTRTYMSGLFIFSFYQNYFISLFDLWCIHSLHQQLMLLDYFVKLLLLILYVYLCMFYQPARIYSKINNLYWSSSFYLSIANWTNICWLVLRYIKRFSAQWIWAVNFSYDV